uniref:T-cell surface glycoprotein CD4-2 protein n=1 Tax=Lutjanus sanguineus TaxID=264213 RepID=A0A1U9XQB5_9TELE|nr:T-cell surface glycoprotein CD4-2 protein [Lutjanus sanguineus]
MKTVVLFGFVLSALSAAGIVIVTKPGESVTLDCGVSSFQSSLEWHYKNGLIIRQSSRSFQSKGKVDIAQRSRLRQTSLTINGVKEEDAGKFTCVVDGRSQDVTLVVVSVSASPSTELQVGSGATLQCQVSGLNPDLTVQWKGPGGQVEKGSPVQLKSVARSDAGTWECTFSHPEGTHSVRLEINVQEPPTTRAPADVPSVPNQNSKDDQKKNCSTCNKTPKAGELLGLSWWMWVIVGVGCLVVILLLVAIICLYKRIKRKKRRLQKMKNSRLPLTTNLYCQCNRPTAAAKPQQGRRREKPSAPPLQLLME